MTASLDSAESAAPPQVDQRRARRFRPRTGPTLAALTAVTVCLAAANWQHDRMLAKAALGAQLAAAAKHEPVALASLPTSADWTALRYRPVEATGEFDNERQILIDNRIHAGRAGFYVVTPMLLGDGRRVLVNRGWIAQGRTRAELPDAPAPAGLVSVRGRIAIPAAAYFELQRAPVTGMLWQNLDPKRYTEATGVEVLPAVIEISPGSPPDDGLTRDWPAADLGVDTHRIYMVQWYAFAILVAFLWLWLNRPRAQDDGSR